VDLNISYKTTSTIRSRNGASLRRVAYL